MRSNGVRCIPLWHRIGPSCCCSQKKLWSVAAGLAVFVSSFALLSGSLRHRLVITGFTRNAELSNTTRSSIRFLREYSVAVANVTAQRNLGDEEEEEREENEQRDREKEEEEWRIGGFQDDAPVYIDDDYYAFQDDPGPPRLLPLKTSDVFGFFVVSMGVTLAAGGGIGGGGIAVPSYILIMGFGPREAIPLCAVTVLGSSAIGTVVNFRRRHPLADRPLIDWNLVIVMEPLVLVGALIGTLLHRVLSEKLLLILLVGLLSVVAYTTLTKARRMYSAETLYIEQLRTHQEESRMRRISPKQRSRKSKEPPYSPSDLPPTEQFPDVSPPTEQSSTNESLNSNVKRQILILNPDFVTLRSGVLEAEKVTPREKIIAMCCMFSVLIFLNIMVGGGAFRSPWGIRCGSVAFWVVHVIMTAFLLASAGAAQTYLVNQHEIKEMISFDFVHGDIRWDSRGAMVYPLIFGSAGMFAGMFGIGGGMICVPLLLTMGVHPIVASATSSCMVLFTSIASTTSFAIFDLILWDYAAICFCLGLTAHFLGVLLMHQARQAGEVNGRTFERNSIIAFCIGGVISLSAIFMTVQYVFNIKGIGTNGDDGGLCEGYRRSV